MGNPSVEHEPNEGLMKALHYAVARELKNRIESGEAAAADLSAAIKFLKDNEVTIQTKPNTGTINELIKGLPFPEEDLQMPDYVRGKIEELSDEPDET